jgi:hypothetical protein
MARKGRGQLSLIERLPDECGPIITWAATELQNRDAPRPRSTKSSS